MKRDTTSPPSSFLTPKQLAARWCVTPMTLRRWRQAGKIRASRIGGVRFSIAEVERYEREAIV